MKTKKKVWLIRTLKPTDASAFLQKIANKDVPLSEVKIAKYCMYAVLLAVVQYY